MGIKLTTELLLAAYAQGLFPMAESRDAKEVGWFYPETRGIIPLDTFHVPASLAKLAKKQPFTLTTDKVFHDVITACADRGEDTWINDTIISAYGELHEKGYAHSVECWQQIPLPLREGDRGRGNAPHPNPPPQGGREYQLVGGLYGVALGGAFFGESMFSKESGASKIALLYLVKLLKGAGYALLDTQYVNDHLKQFGVIEIARAEYLQRLPAAMQIQTKNCWKNFR